MFDWLKKKARESTVMQKVRESKFGTPVIITEDIDRLVRALFFWRLQNDYPLWALISASSPDLNRDADAEGIAAGCDRETLYKMPEFRIVCLLAMYARARVRMPETFTYRDILYNLDQIGPKRAGHIPVETWGPKDIFEYVAYAIKLEQPDDTFPFFKANDVLKAILEELMNYYRQRPNA
jgi:hypothetical protein